MHFAFENLCFAGWRGECQRAHELSGGVADRMQRERAIHVAAPPAARHRPASMKATPREPAGDSNEHASPIPSTSKAPEHSVNFLPMMPRSSEAMSIPSGLVASAYLYRLLTRSSSRHRSHSHAFFVIPPNSMGHAHIATPRRADSTPAASGRSSSPRSESVSRRIGRVCLRTLAGRRLPRWWSPPL